MNPRITRRPSRLASGFTLIELLLVLVILAVLAAVVVPKFTNRSEQARVAAAKTDIANVETALDAFEIDTGHYPSNEQGLNALLEMPSGSQGWKGPYLKKPPVDPWGHEYVYRFPGTQNPSGYDLFSMGVDGREGNDDIDSRSTTK